MPDFAKKTTIEQPSQAAQLTVLAGDIAQADNERRAYRAVVQDLMNAYNEACDEIARLNALLAEQQPTGE